MVCLHGLKISHIPAFTNWLNKAFIRMIGVVVWRGIYLMKIEVSDYSSTHRYGALQASAPYAGWKRRDQNSRVVRSYLSWPRISPPLCASLCTLTYIPPALSIVVCSAVNIVPAGKIHSLSPFIVSDTTTGPLAPATPA
jgi:hypothetical protein